MFKQKNNTKPDSSSTSPRRVSIAEVPTALDGVRGSRLLPRPQLNRASSSSAGSSSESPPRPRRSQQPAASPRAYHKSPLSTVNMPTYTSRDVGDPSQIKKTKQSMADLKLRRLTELNNRLREDLERERIPVSSAAKR